MVKYLDENTEAWPDHVGWRLWQANRAWQAAFVAAMRDAGHGWMTDARAALLGHIGRRGTPQSALIDRMGSSKQAVQQLVDGLESEEIICRVPDPDDRRARIVVHTEKGRLALRDADRIKREIEQAYRARLGTDRFDALKSALEALALPQDGKNPGDRGG